MLRTPDFLVRIVQHPKYPAWIRAIRRILVACALLFMGWAAFVAFGELRSQQMGIEWSSAAIGVLLTIPASFLGSCVWYLVVRGVGLSVGYRQATVIHMAANVAKYLPGYAWHYVSKGYLLKEKGYSNRQVSLVVLSELVLVLASGAFLGSLTVAAYAIPILGRHISSWVGLAVACAVAGATILWLFRVRTTIAPCGRSLACRAGAVGWLGLAWLAATASWLFLTLATLSFIRTFAPAASVDLPHALVAVTISSIVSLLVVFVPAGLGVREATLAALLAPTVAPAVGITVSIFMRFAVILAELAQLGLVVLWADHWPQGLSRLVLPERRSKNTPNGVL